MGPLSYEGPEKYIFISYAHKDSDRVMHILEKLTESGYRIWYDDGIAPGSEWPEEIAEHLAGCAAFMSFISNHSMESANCRREINFALSRQKPFLGIILEPTKMTLGMEMQLSSQHCLIRENYRKEEDFLRKLFSSPDLQCCKAPEPRPKAVPVVQAAAAETMAAPPVQSVAAAVQPTQPIAAAPKPEKAAEPEVRLPKKKSGKVVDGEITEKKPSKLKKVLAGLVAAVAIAGVAAFGLSSANSLELAPDVVVKKTDTSVSLRDKEITADTLKKLNQMEELRSLYLYQCTVEDGDLSALQNERLTRLHAENTPITELPDLQAVTNLLLINCGITDETFAGTQPHNLVTLRLSGNSEFSDLTIFKPEQLQSVVVDGTAVADLSSLSKAAKLGELNCSRTAVTSLEPLSGLEKLHSLRAAGCALSALDTPFMSLSMKTLDLSACGLVNLAGGEYFTVLEKVYLGGNKLTRVDWLGKSAATLYELDLSGNPLSREQLEFLSGCGGMEQLNVSGISLGDCSLFGNLQALQVLRAADCGITDISDLSALFGLRELYLSGNAITDLSPLPPFAANGHAIGFAKLDLAYNNISDISSIQCESFSALALQGNPVSVDGDSFGKAKGLVLTMDYDEGLQSIPKPEFSYIYVANCPPDRQLALEKSFGYGLTCATEAELLDALAQKNIYY